MQGAIEGLKAQAAWKWSNGCKDVSSKAEQKFCQQFAGLNSELASASAATEANTHLEAIKTKISTMEGSPALSEADPQAKVLTELASAFFPNVKIENVQMTLTIFVALLLEIGSGFGMYVAFSQWRLYDVEAPAAPKMVAAVENTAAAAVAAPVLTPAAVQSKKPRSGANDNKTIGIPVESPVAEPDTIEAQIAEARTLVERQPEVRAIESRQAPAKSKLLVPETDVQRFYRENIEVQDGSSVTATQLYEDYCSWCDTKNKEPSALPSFAREFADLGVKKEKVAGRVRYIGIALKSDLALEEAATSLLYRADAA